MSAISVGSLLPRVHAVLIGIDTYKFGWSKLKYAESDVNGLAQTLQRDCGWSAAAIHPLTGSRAKLRAVRDTIKDALESADADELVLIYFSGHAELTAKQELFLAAWDTKSDSLSNSGYPASSILDLMDASAAGYVVLILDCCYAGAIGGPTGRLAQLWNLNAKPRLSRGLGRAVISSCWHNELSSERQVTAPGQYSDSELQYASSGHGVFTFFLMEGLRGGGQELQAVNKFGEVDAASLTDYIRRQLRGEQTPDFYSRGTFPVLVKRREWMGEALMDQEHVSGRRHPTQRAVAKQLWRREGFPSPMTACDLTPDGSRIIAAFDDGSVALLSASDGHVIEQIVAARASSVIRRLVASPNSSILAMVTEDRRTNVSSISVRTLGSNSDPIKLDPWSSPVSRLMFSPVSQLIAATTVKSAPDNLGCIHVWDTQGNTFARLVRDEFSGIAVQDFSFCFPDGKRLVSALDKRANIYLWDINTENREAGTSRAIKLLERADWELGDESVLVASSMSDKYVVSAVLGKAGRLCMWSLPDGAPVSQTVALQGVPTSLTASPNSEWVMCGSSSYVYPIHVSHNGRLESASPMVFSSRVSSAVFSPDPTSNLVAAAAADGEVRLWDIVTGVEVALEVVEGSGRKSAKRQQVPRETQMKFSKEGTRMLIYSKAGALLEMWQLDWTPQT